MKPAYFFLLQLVGIGIIGFQLLFLYVVVWNNSSSDLPSLYSLTHNIYTLGNNPHSSKDNIVLERRDAPVTCVSELERVLGTALPPSDHPDLRHRPRSEVIHHLSRIFSELPPDGKFSSLYRNPCWEREPNSPNAKLQCLPLAYILGQPKCGTSDLYQRISSHPMVVHPKRKEIRWFTRGEFLSASEEGMEIRKDSSTSLSTFTNYFAKAAEVIAAHPDYITIEGGPHTLWWSTQAPNGTYFQEDIPPAQIMREMQKDALFIVTLCDPVKRMYSDYNFLNDDLKPVKQSEKPDSKSAVEFHERVVIQINEMEACIASKAKGIGAAENFRAAQECAHDRHTFAVGGWGRLSVGMYVLFIAKWLEHFPLRRFLVLRLEDFDSNPQTYMRRVFSFLSLPEPTSKEWVSILRNQRANANRHTREPMLAATEALLRSFYQPYNDMLATLLRSNAFSWSDTTEWPMTVSHPENQHGAGPREHLIVAPASLTKPPTASRHTGRLRLRTRPEDSGLVDLKPRSFNSTDLPWPYFQEIPDFNDWMASVLTRNSTFQFNAEAAVALCAASFALDVAAVKYLLFDVGISAKLHLKDDAERTALHCLSLIEVLADANSKSYIFAQLKARSTWLTPVLDPPLPLKSSVPMASDIIASMELPATRIAQWLLRAGADVNAPDVAQNTPLHLAAYGGIARLVELFLNNGANANVLNKFKRSPLHYAMAQGHTKCALLLIEAGADLDIKDVFNSSPRDMVESPGAISSQEALQYFNISQRQVRSIGRIIHPELSPESALGWAAGTGGWGPERLNGTETDMHCDVDQYFAHEISGDQIFEKYLARSAPVLIRGLLNEWGLVNSSTREALLNSFHANRTVSISEIPYSDKFGGSGIVEQMPLREYIEQVHEHRVGGGRKPDYLFKGHNIPTASEANDSFIPYPLCPTPESIYQAVLRIPSAETRASKVAGHRMRDPFINAQWSLGVEGSGAPMHFHNPAWSALIYGAKKWFLYPPRNMIMSNEHILDFQEIHMPLLAKRGILATTCIQTAGDVLIVPESWGHGVLNIQESVSVATELIDSLWRIRPAPSILSQVPNDNRRENSKSMKRKRIKETTSHS